MAKKILVADDDPKVVGVMKLYLKQEGYHVLTASDGRRTLEIVREHHPDLVLLDLMMPDLDGLDVCRVLRTESNIPIIMLTARTTEDNRILGLDLGADDYVIKPASPREVVARVRAVLRRVTEPEADRGPRQLRLGSVLVDFRRHEATHGEDPVPLTPTEFKLLHVLAADPGRAFSRGALVDQVLGAGYEGFERTIDAHVKNLRRKIEPDPSHPRYIGTVFGVGYRLEEAGP